MLKITRLTALFLLFLAFSNVYSQDKTIDSMKLVVQNPKIHDTVKLYSLLTIKSQKYLAGEEGSYILNHMQGDYAMKCLKKKVDPEIRKIYVQCLAEYYSSLMTEYRLKDDIPKALASINKSIALFKSEKLYNDMYFSVMEKGIFYGKIRDYDKAIACLFSAMRYFEKHPGEYPVTEMGSIYSNIASLYGQQKNYEKSIEYNKKLIALFDSLTKNSEYQQGADNSKFVAYSNVGTCYRNLKQYDEAMRYYDLALQVVRKSGSVAKISFMYTRIGMLKLMEKKYDEAEVYLKDALKGDLDDSGLANANTAIGQLYFEKKDYDKAYSFLTKGLELSIATNNADLQEMGSDLLLKLSTIRKDYKMAFEMYKLKDSITDSKKTETSKNALEKQMLKYDFEKKEFNYKLAAQKKSAAKNNWLIGLSGVILLLLLGVYFYYRNTKQKQSIAVLEKDQIKQKLLITQMNPHFIFNSIGNIQQLIYDNKDEDAIKYLDRFSILTRQILENSNENYISLHEEVAMIGNYLSIQQLLYSNKFSYTIFVEEEIDQETIFLPPMLTQPFIENAIKHGLAGKENSGKIDIRFFLTDGKLYFEVLDNGTGFDASKPVGSHKSLAMTITKERLVSYTRNRDFVVQTDNIKDANHKIVGAKVSFEIPYIYEN